MDGNDWSLHGLAAAADCVVTECNGDVYLGPNVCAGVGSAVYSYGSDVYNATVEGVPVLVMFSHNVAPLAAITDPFGSRLRCQPLSTARETEATLECSWPDDVAYQVQPNGRSRMWLYKSPSYGIDTALLATACVLAFAVLLDRSKQTTTALKLGRTPTAVSTKWTANLYRDLVVSVLWLLTYALTTHMPRHLLHPSTGVLVPDTNTLDMLGTALYVAMASNGIVSTVCMTRKLEPVLCRTTYEVFLLLGMVVMTPVSVAPMFHALFEACVAASVMFITCRDCLWQDTTVGRPLRSVLIILISALNCGIAVLLMLPALVDCDAVPALAEPYLAVVVGLQICVASVLYRGRDHVGGV